MWFKSEILRGAKINQKRRFIQQNGKKHFSNDRIANI